MAGRSQRNLSCLNLGCLNLGCLNLGCLSLGRVNLGRVNLGCYFGMNIRHRIICLIRRSQRVGSVVLRHQ
ncbi:MAG: hypothetical protein ACLPZJ_15805 [Terriglobales bacterium]